METEVTSHKKKRKRLALVNCCVTLGDQLLDDDRCELTGFTTTVVS